ncbi:hypothetical protein HYX14_01885 [Candidatus Woesearchaeota archaeon]|nr:hypothetical protein [Candidatus Woesearchaeota archaeon]
MRTYIQNDQVRELTSDDIITIYSRILEFDLYLLKHPELVNDYRDVLDVLKTAQRNHNRDSFRTTLEALISKILRKNPALKPIPTVS